MRYFFQAFLIIFLLLPYTAGAVGVYSVAPLVIDQAAAPRDIINTSVTVTNEANHILSIFPSVHEIDLAAGGEAAEFEGPSMVMRSRAITSWIEISRAEINLKPGESRMIPVVIRMNPNAEPGEYHAIIGFGSGRTRNDAEALVMNGQAPHVTLTIRVADTAVEYMDVKGFRIDKFITSTDNSALAYSLTNPGDTVIVPEGEIIIYDGNGKEVTSIPANPSNQSLRPGETIDLATTVPIAGMLGKYKAFLSVRYGTNQAANLQDTAFFYALPLQKLLIIFAIIATIVIGVTLFFYYRFSDDEYDEDGADYVPLRIKQNVSADKDHDIDLKKTV